MPKWSHYLDQDDEDYDQPIQRVERIRKNRTPDEGKLRESQKDRGKNPPPMRPK